MSLSQSRRGLAAFGAVVGFGLLPACGGGNVASNLTDAPKYEPGGAAKCGTATASWRPLLVEWSGTDRANLESRIGQGLVPVRVSGCDIEILPSCKAPAKYMYTGTTLKRDTLLIRNTDELHASVPFGAASLTGDLQRSGQLSVKLSVVGVYAAEQASVRAEDMMGNCDSATHVISGFAAGAFEFFAGADAGVGAGVGVGEIGVDGKSTSKYELLNKDGDDAACTAGKTSDTAPPQGCGALLRLSLMPIDCFEGMQYIEGKGCRPIAKDQEGDPAVVGTLLSGLESKLALLESQIVEIQNGSPVWAKRADELKGEWRRAGLKAGFESLNVEALVLKQNAPATSEQNALLTRADALKKKAAERVAFYEKELSR